MKIHTLELPMEHVGSVSRTPYALIISGCTELQRQQIQQRGAYLQELVKSDKPRTPEYVLLLTDEVDTP